MQFKVGEKVIYPNQGVGIVEGICRENIAGTDQDFYLLRMVGHNSTVMVPTQNVDHVGLRKLCNKEQLGSLFEILRDDFNEMNVDWKHRYKNNVERMNSGSIFEVAKVLKSLYFLSYQKSLSFREKKMFDRARQLVISEIATVEQKPLSDVERLVEELLSATYERMTS